MSEEKKTEGKEETAKAEAEASVEAPAVTETPAAEAAAADTTANTGDAPIETTEEASASSKEIALNGTFAAKVGMATIFNETGTQIPVTVLKMKPWVVTQIKTPEKDNYSAVQISLMDKKEKNTTAAAKGHAKKAGFDKAATLSREIRQELPEGIQVGQEVSMSSLAKGDEVKITAKSKGRGFCRCDETLQFCWWTCSSRFDFPQTTWFCRKQNLARKNYAWRKSFQDILVMKL